MDDISPQDLKLLTTQANTEDDVEQEKWLIFFEKRKVASKAIIRKKLSRDRVLFYSMRPEEAQALWQNQRVNLDAINDLVDWTLNQSEEIQALMYLFLDSPELKLEETLEALARAGIIESQEDKDKVKKVPIAQLVLRELKTERTKDELIQFIQRIAPETKRPAARVRQLLRRWIPMEQVTQLPNGSYVIGPKAKLKE